MNKEFFTKNKKVFLICFGIVFVVLMLFLKSNSSIKNSSVAQVGLVYNSETLNDLVSRDTDGDGVMDWEESLWGTDPKNPDTNGDGIGDTAEIAKMKEASGKTNDTKAQEEEDLTQTDKLSRELFTSVAALSQTGGMDQNTVDQLSASLAQQIQNPVIRKVFVTSDLKTTTDNSTTAIQTYGSNVGTLFGKYKTVYSGGVVIPIVKTAADALQTYLDTGDADALSKLNPIIKDIASIVDQMSKMTVPNGMVTAHVGAMNEFELVEENLNDIKTVDIDPVVAMGAADKFSSNVTTLQDFIDKLRTAINQGLKH